MMPPSIPQPFRTNEEHLTAEIEVVRVRCAYLAAKLKVDDLARDVALVRAPSADAGAIEEAQRHARLCEAAEKEARADLDRRLRASGAARADLGLESLCAAFDLDACDRATVVLSLIPTLGFDLGQILGDLVVAVSSVWDAPSPRLVALYCSVDVPGGSEFRRRYSKSGALIRHGIVRFDYSEADDVEAFATAPLRLNLAALHHILGLENPEPDPVCLGCGQPVRSPWSRTN